ncbi:unnamed protein product [Strongylus vulgaris]|uniref:Uncharacterized protein n=1 Tax=Strongylus vulgaris TaxID=40348 RepID=A0A3P7LE36_STRVU|nr:unnamed protein product [Strongylus vulgaris]
MLEPSLDDITGGSPEETTSGYSLHKENKMEGKILRTVTAYAPQTGCKEKEKNMFWQELDDYIASIPQDDSCSEQT